MNFPSKDMTEENIRHNLRYYKSQKDHGARVVVSILLKDNRTFSGELNFVGDKCFGLYVPSENDDHDFDYDEVRSVQSNNATEMMELQPTV